MGLRGPKPRSMAEQYEARVVRGLPDECWLTTGGVSYPHGLEGGRNGRQVYFHRWLFGEPDGEVMHSCDDPRCVNPSHLSIGVHADNMGQMAERGRASGPLNPATKLNGRWRGRGSHDRQLH